MIIFVQHNWDFLLHIKTSAKKIHKSSALKQREIVVYNQFHNGGKPL
jgi:hypothetical protein